MTAAQRYIAMALFIVTIAFSMVIFNSINNNYADDGPTGRLLIPIEQTPYLNATDLGLIDSTVESLNTTQALYAEFNKPQDIAFDFDFWQTLRTLPTMVQLMVDAVYGFPAFLHSAYGLPIEIAIAIQILMNLGVVLLLAFIVLKLAF